jgi:hypothetical protein
MSGEVHIAYQVVGEGELDLVLIPSIFDPYGAQPIRWNARSAR